MVFTHLCPHIPSSQPKPGIRTRDAVNTTHISPAGASSPRQPPFETSVIYLCRSAVSANRDLNRLFFFS